MSWKAQLSHLVKELRIHFCQSSPSSQPARDFIMRNYKEIKTLNPELPILLRECSGIQPRIWARYAYGVERSILLEGLTEPQIAKKLEELVNLPTGQ